jgi:hypothetical protein
MINYEGCFMKQKNMQYFFQGQYYNGVMPKINCHDGAFT